MLLPDVEQHVLRERLRGLRVGELELGDLGGEPRVEALGDVHVLVEAAHHRPQVRLLEVERDVVLGQLVLAVAEAVQDRVELALRALVLAEVVRRPCHRRAAGPSSLRDAPGLARVELLDGTAQLEQRLADLRALGQAALAERRDRLVEHPVRRLGGLADVGVAHGAHRVGLMGELRAARRRAGQRGHEAIDLGVELGNQLGRDLGRHRRSLRRHDHRRRRRCGEGQRRLRGLERGGCRRGLLARTCAHRVPLPLPCACACADDIRQVAGADTLGRSGSGVVGDFLGASPFSTLVRGGVSERPKEHASKACVGASPPWVQIPPPPPQALVQIEGRSTDRKPVPSGAGFLARVAA